MKLPFSKKQPPQPIISDPHSADTSLLPVPATTIMPTVKTVEPKQVQPCAFCGNDGATHPFGVGDFYLGKLKYPRLCDDCYTTRQRKELVHHYAQKKTRVETPAVKANGGFVKPGIAIVGEPGPEIVAIPRDAVIYPNKPQAETPTIKMYLDGIEFV